MSGFDASWNLSAVVVNANSIVMQLTSQRGDMNSCWMIAEGAFSLDDLKIPHDLIGRFFCGISLVVFEKIQQRKMEYSMIANKLKFSRF